MKKYIPINSVEVPRFAEINTYMRLPNVRTTEDIDYAVIGVPFDTGTSYRPGSRFGPSAIRDISSLIKPYNFVQKVNVVDELSGVDYGDIVVIPGYIEDTYERIKKEIELIAKNGVIPICMGGDHSITLGELRALKEIYGPVALIHIDAHTDTVDTYFGKKYTHGTVFRRAVEEGVIDVSHSIQMGMRGTFYSEDDINDSKELGLKCVTTFEMRQMAMEEIIATIHERVKDKKAFLSFDIDFVDPAYAPGTGTIEAGGFTSTEALSMVRGMKGINFVGFDMVEVLPAYDPSQITASLAANIMFEFISLIALNKKMNGR